MSPTSRAREQCDPTPGLPERCHDLEARIAKRIPDVAGHVTVHRARNRFEPRSKYARRVYYLRFYAHRTDNYEFNAGAYRFSTSKACWRSVFDDFLSWYAEYVLAGIGVGGGW